MSDKYRICTAVFRGRTDKAFFVKKNAKDISIPRSLIHGGDDLKIDRLNVDDEFTFRLREWKAEELGLA